MTVLSQRLRIAMAAKGWPQKTLAAHMGVNQSLVAYYITGRGVPTQERAQSICEALGCPKDWLLDPTPFSFEGPPSLDHQEAP